MLFATFGHHREDRAAALTDLAVWIILASGVDLDVLAADRRADFDVRGPAS
jgi:hypothetical protein